MNAPQPNHVIDGRARMHALRAWLEAQTGSSVELHETHISWVLLAGEFAYKLKKPVKLSFLDFSTLQARRHFCEEELRLNRRLAPTLYLEVLELSGGPHGTGFGVTGPVVDAVLKMQRFPPRALLSERLAAGSLAPEDIDRLAQRIAAFHRGAEVAPPDSGFGRAGAIEQTTRRTMAGIAQWIERGDAPGADAWPALRRWLDAEMKALAQVWDERRQNGWVRECHGDLHLANTLVLGDEVTAFDCIEFDPALRWIDAMNDVAFLVMDLLAHGRASLAFRFLDGWLQSVGDFEGLVLLRFAMVSRALVRAQVCSIAQSQGVEGRAGASPDASDYLRLAARLADARDPRLLITHGLPGSGKSFFSQRLLEQAGAVRLRSDVERKRLFGLEALETSAGKVAGLYESAATERTYARLLDGARIALRAGYPTIVDAAFLRRDERERFRELAREERVPFAILDCQAPPELLRERLRQRLARGGDASEADEAVLAKLERAAEPLVDDEQDHALRAEGSEAIAVLGEQWLAATVLS